MWESSRKLEAPSQELEKTQYCSESLVRSQFSVPGDQDQRTGMKGESKNRTAASRTTKGQQVSECVQVPGPVSTYPYFRFLPPVSAYPGFEGLL
ncbi:hypothetical protein Y1Q_0003003 [Alligator mississippiensis]|uniref:Uncharacterized protein n=1 Tax=Alligator mississippiensis TaxID=8496 RepID=A0A151MD37_ALLMI|nr:hypothetical protein Y1Q_0003003 [Alligator mississippiensis]